MYQRSFIASVLVSLVTVLSTVPAVQAAASPDVYTNSSYKAGYTELAADPDGSVFLRWRFPGVTLRSFQDSDSGRPELLDTIVQPNGRYVYFSVRLDQHYPSYNTVDLASVGPFITKLYRFDLTTGKLARIYREEVGSGYTFVGFDGNKLLMTVALYGDNSPGPCWYEEMLAAGNDLKYIDAQKPAAGVKKYVPTKKFKQLKREAYEQCYGEVYP